MASKAAVDNIAKELSSKTKSDADTDKDNSTISTTNIDVNHNWLTRLNDLSDRLLVLENDAGTRNAKQRDNNNAPYISSIATRQEQLKSKTEGDGFVKLCNRVDLLDGKLNKMKTILDKLLTKMTVIESRILDTNFPNSSLVFRKRGLNSLRTRKAFTSHARYGDNNDDGGDDISGLDNFETEMDNDDSSNSNWFPSALEEEDPLNVDVKPIIVVDEIVPDPVGINLEETGLTERRSSRISKRLGKKSLTMETNIRNDNSDSEQDISNPSQSQHYGNDLNEDGNDGNQSEQEGFYPGQDSDYDPEGQDRPDLELKLPSGSGGIRKYTRNSISVGPRYPPLQPDSLKRDPETNLYQCPACKNTFKERNKLERHYIMHTGETPFVCNVESCQRGFTRKDKLRDHYVAEHPGQMPPELVVTRNNREAFLCPDCGKLSANRVNLENHMNACRGNKPYLCPTCGRRFAQKSALTAHINGVHKKIKKFVCNDCGKSFPASGSYQRHMRRMHYRGEKPFSCKYCEKCFAIGNDLRRHEVRHEKKLNVIIAS